MSSRSQSCPRKTGQPPSPSPRLSPKLWSWYWYIALPPALAVSLMGVDAALGASLEGLPQLLPAEEIGIGNTGNACRELKE